MNKICTDRIKCIYVSSEAQEELTAALTGLADRVITVSPRGITYPAVDAHPDMYYCKMGVTRHCHIFAGDPAELGTAYPENIRFNAVCLDGYFIHNLKHTSPALLREAQAKGLECIHVRQGYTKCSCVVVDGYSLITSDEGIIHTLQGYTDIHVLKIRPGFVQLPGFPYGFLGGASGRVGHEILFHGDLAAHPDHEAIRRFIVERGLAVRDFPQHPLRDIGSILADEGG